MSEAIVSLRYTFHCHRCGDRWTASQDVEAPGIEYSPPPIPQCCPKCGGSLAGDPRAWRRIFEVTEVQIFE